MIDTKAIRSKILDAAIRGLLTQQLPEDGTAAELYQKIQKEKQKLIEAGKVKKEKPLPEITEEEIPFEIPENWKWVRLYSISYSIFAGGDKPQDFVKEKDHDHQVPVVANAVSNDGIMGYTSHATAPSNTLTVAGRGTIGFTCYRDYDYCPIVRLIVIEQCRSIEPRYLFFVFNKLAVESVGSSIPQLTVPMVRPKQIPLPPLAEQKRIVERLEQVFSVLDEIDELQSRYTDNLAVLRSKLIDAAIQGKLTEQLPEDGTAEELYQQIQKEKQELIKAGKIKKEKPLPEIKDEEIPFEIPENWKWVRLGDYMDVRDGTHESPDFYAEGYPLVTSKNLKNGEVDLSNVKYISKADYDSINLRSRVDEGDILFAMIGSIGNPAIVGKEHVYAIKNVALFKKIIPECNEYYIYYYFYLVQFTMREKARGGLQPFVSLSYLRRFLLPLPPLSEQHRIVERLDELLALCGG